MHVISWNVAGLKQTVKRIHDNYGPEHASNGKKMPASAALHEYMKRHDVDIFCLQEAKIPIQQLSSRSEPLSSSTVEGYESFWSCCTDKKKLGFNGVVTYAKKGTVRRADAFALGASELDDQGRCVMTDHGTFVIFNVYVPASGGNSLTYKMKFLHALRRAMKKERQIKPVILVGDLNISHTKLDRYWSDRVIQVDEILEQIRGHGDGPDVPLWKRDVAKSWEKIETVLATKEIIETQTTNSRTGAKYDKFRLCVSVDGVRVYLGGHESSKECCEYFYQFDEWHYECPETGDLKPASIKNEVSIVVLSELMNKIAGIEWNETLQRQIADDQEGIARISPTRQWLECIIQQDEMVDVFRHFYPTAKDRFTCWNQYTNRRYVNEGCRIDYTLVDKSLLPMVRKGQVESLRTGGSKHDPLGEEAAICAATANGEFEPVSFEGNGIMEATQTALDTQFGLKHSGMIYTPPSFSDHIGVSLLMDAAFCPRDLILDEKDRATRKAQPHKAQTTIASFFSGDGYVPLESNDATTQKKRMALSTVEVQKRSSSFVASRRCSEKPEAIPVTTNLVAKRVKRSCSVVQPTSKPGSIPHFFRK